MTGPFLGVLARPRVAVRRLALASAAAATVLVLLPTSADAATSAPTSVVAGSPQPGEVAVRWTKPAGTISNYRVRLCWAGANPGCDAGTTTVTATSATITGARIGQQRYASVTAVGTDGSVSAVAASAAFTVYGQPWVPRSVTASASGPGRITLSWQRPGDDGEHGSANLSYGITATASSGTAPSARSTTGTTLDYTGLTTGTTYTFTVRATNAYVTGNGASSGAQAATAPQPPGTTSITGAAQYAHTLSAATQGWASGSTFRYQWLNGSVPIAGATAQTFVIRSTYLLGKRLAVRVTGVRAGYLDANATSALTAAVTQAPMVGGSYWMGGTPTVGATWVPRMSGWPSGTAFTYNWSVNGTTVSTASTYAPPNSLLNTRLVAQVTGSGAPGYAGSVMKQITLRVQPANPLAGELWPAALQPSNSDFNWDAGLTAAWQGASGTTKTMLGKIVSRPRVVWFHAGTPASSAALGVTRYIQATQKGNANSLVQLALFGIFSLQPGGEGDRNKALTTAQIQTYKDWMTAMAKAIGTTRVAIVMEPDLALLAPSMSGEINTADPGVREGLVKWAVQLLAKNPNAAIYLDAGDSDWQSVARMAPILQASGVAYARGFALGATHYTPIGSEIDYGGQLAKALSDAGAGSKHFVIDSADNGKGFTWLQYKAKYGSATFDNATVCASTSTPPPCNTLGVKPTWQVIDAGVGLTDAQKATALADADGYLWFGRPWLNYQAWPFDQQRAVGVGASSPYN